MIDPVPPSSSARSPGHCPAAPDAGTAPTAPVLSYAHLPAGHDPRSRNWLTTAGILWIIYSIALLIIVAGLGNIIHQSLLYYVMSDDPRFFQRVFTLGIVTAVLLALGVIAIVLSILSFKSRRRIVTFAPAFSIFMLMADLLLTLIVSDLLSRAIGRIDQPVAQVVLGLASLPKIILALLCWIHLRNATKSYLLHHDHRLTAAAPRPITQWLLIFWANAIGCISLFYWALVHTYYSYETPSQLTFRRVIPFIAAGSFLLAWATLSGKPVSRIFGICWYGLCLISAITFHEQLFDRSAFGLPACFLLFPTLVVLHARNQIPSAKPQQ